MPVEVSSMMPTRMKDGIEQLDRFSTYDEADMWWAEPLGLARWKWVSCHAMKVRIPEISPLIFQFDRPQILEPRYIMKGCF